MLDIRYVVLSLFVAAVGFALFGIVSAARSQMIGDGVMRSVTTSGPPSGNSLLADTGQPIYSVGTTPILVQ